LVAIVLVPTAAFAALQINDDVQIKRPTAWTPSGGYGSGGPFQLDFYTDPTHSTAVYTPHGGGGKIDQVYSFCAERWEYISLDGWYNIGSDGIQSVGGTRQLTGYAAWVYDTWLNHASYQGFTKDNNNLFQQAIWAGMVYWNDANKNGVRDEGEYAAVGSAPQPYGSYPATGGSEFEITNWNPYTAIWDGTTMFNISWAEFRDNVTWQGISPGDDLNGFQRLLTTGDFRLLNLDIPIDQQKQSQLFLSAGSLTLVPEPASLLIWSVAGGLAAAGAAVRRRRPTRWSKQNRQAIHEIIRGA
jgi:hypothetical protein